jgi:hypothetical protein
LNKIYTAASAAAFPDKVGRLAAANLARNVTQSLTHRARDTGMAVIFSASTFLILFWCYVTHFVEMQKALSRLNVRTKIHDSWLHCRVNTLSSHLPKEKCVAVAAA